MAPKPVRVAVSGFDGLDNPHPGAGVAAALREGWPGPIEIDALVYEADETAAWMPGAADAIHLIPLLDKGDDAMLARLLEIHAARPIDVLVPCLDLEVPVIARIAADLEEHGIQTLIPGHSVVNATTKLRLPKFCHEQDIPTPRTIHVYDLSDLPLHAKQFGFPLMLKGTVAGARKVHNVDEAMHHARKFNREWGGGVLLQQPVQGDEFVVAAVSGRDHRTLGAVAMRKIGISGKGKAIFGAVVEEPETIEQASQILQRLKWRGPLELEFIRQRGGSAVHLIEINCRFPSWVSLCARAGANLPVLAVAEALGRRQSRRQAPRAGASFVRDVDETAILLSDRQALSRTGTLVRPAAEPARRRRDPAGLSVAISGIATLDVINAGLGVARAINRAPGVSRVIGLGYGAYDSGMYRPDLFDAVYRLPTYADPEQIRQRLEQIHAETPFDVVIPCLDGEIPNFIANREALGKLGVEMLLPGTAAFNRRDKLKLFTGKIEKDWGGFHIPDTRKVKSERGLIRAAQDLGFPVMVKGAISLAIKAEGNGDLAAAWRQLQGEGNQEVLVQRFVDGPRYAVAAVCGRNHETLCSFTIKKLRTCDRGSTWSAISVKEPALEEAFARFLEAIKWVGPAEGEFMRDSVTDEFALIEVNPRFTGWISFAADLGLNHPYLAAMTAAGRDVASPAEVERTVFMRATRDIPVSPARLSAISTRGGLRYD